MMRHLPPLQCIAAFGMALMIVSPQVALAQSEDDFGRPKITAVRHWSLGTVTRIVIESSGEFRFKADRLQNPDRIFFDLIGARPQVGTHDRKGVTVIEVGDQFVRQLRIAETQRGITRVVCDLAAPVEYTTSQLSSPDRLVIELHSTLVTKVQHIDGENAPAQIEPPARPTPRMAILDFSASRQSREMAVRSMTPVLPDPPSPFDPGARFARWAFYGIDPFPTTSWTPRAGPLPKPQPPARVMPGVIAKSLPPLIPERPRPGGELAKVTSIPAPLTITPATPIVSATVPAAPAASSASEEIGLPAKRTSKEDTMIRVLGLKLGRVVIDAGHGGPDAGTSSEGGLHEKDIVLDVAKRLGAMLEARLGSEVVYTRTDDRFVALGRRAEIANEKKADLFLSIHVNSSPSRVVGGVETYYLNFTTSKTSLDTAMRENAGADRNIGDLQDLLKKIALKDKVEESREFASCIQTSLVSLSPKAARTASDRGVKRAPFVVLIGASMPSVLAEVGFISNSRDEAQMRRPEHRQKIAEALYEGVAAYANTLSHFQVAQQQSRLDKTSPAQSRKAN